MGKLLPSTNDNGGKYPLSEDPTDPTPCWSLFGFVPKTRKINAGIGLTGSGALSRDVTLNVNFGTEAGTVVEGNDPRLSATGSGEWNAPMVTQEEAIAGNSNSATKWSASLVHDGARGWWEGSAYATKLDGIENGATKNSSDAQLRNREFHTGQQEISTILGLEDILAALANGEGGGDPGTPLPGISAEFVSTIQDLKNSSSKGIVRTNGYYTRGDGGNAIYKYVEDSTATVDDVLVFSHASGSGRWHMVVIDGRVSLHQAGAHGIPNSSPRIQALFDAVRDTDITVTASGTFDLLSTVFTNNSLDMREATFNFAAGFNGSAGLVVSPDLTINPSTRLRARMLKLPKVIKAKPNLGWAGSARGIVLYNLYHCEIIVNHIQGWAYGLRCVGINNTGFVYNTVYLGLIFNNRVNLHLQAAAPGGWCNENTFIGGVLALESAEGIRVAGTKLMHLEVASTWSGPNNNVFLGTCLEGRTDEYAIYCQGGANNMWLNCRFETGSAAGKAVCFDQQAAQFNVIMYGHSSNIMRVDEINGSRYNQLYTTSGVLLRGTSADSPIMGVSNGNGDAKPAIASYGSATPIGDYNDNNYRAAMNGFGVVHKLDGDTADSVQLASGALKLGDGTNAPTSRISGTNNATRFTNGDVLLFDHSWSQNRLRLGNHFLWVDSAGVLRIKNSAPTSATDGTIVGTQS